MLTITAMRTRTRIRKYKKPLKATPTPRVMLGVGLLVAALFVWIAQTDGSARSAATTRGFAPAATLSHAVALAEAAPRLVYRYSVIPGGVASSAALAGEVMRDPVVAAHYAKFDVAKARVVKLAAPQWKHVSYRVGDKVFWTSKKVMLAAGEAVITDGKITARTRCGNQVSDVAMAPVMMANEPAPEVLDMMYASADGISDAAAEVPVGQGAAPLAVDTPPVQTAAVSDVGQAPRAASSSLTPMWSTPGIDPVRTKVAPPIVLHGVVVTPPSPTPVPADTPPVPSTPPKPQDPPVPTDSPSPTPPPPTPTPQDPAPPPAPPAPPSKPPASLVPPRAPTPVPEPGSISLMAGALAAMLLLRRKKRGHPLASHCQ